MKAITGFKYRLYPNKAQVEQFNKNIGCCRFVYNWALGMKKDAYEKDGTNLSIRKDISPMLPSMKKQDETSFLSEADSQALIGELNNLDAAYKNFFKRGGFPKFKKRSSNGSFTFQVKKDKWGTFNQGYLKLGKSGMVRVRVHKPLDIENVKEYVTISRNSIGEFYIAVKYETEIPDEPKAKPTVENTIGCDFGVHDLVILDDGTKFKKFVSDKKFKKKKRRLQRALARKTVKSANGKVSYKEQSSHYKKIQKQLAKIDLTIARKRERYQYEVVKGIVGKDCTYIGVEDLNVKGMISTGKSKRKKLTADEYAKLTSEEKTAYNRKKPKQFNRSISEQALGELRLKLTNKAVKNGKKVIVVDRFYASSQTCSNCGHVNTNVKNLNVRKWICPHCGIEHDRDVNAAINIRNKAVGSLSESNNINLPECIGKVMSPEAKLGETKQNENFQRNISKSAPIEGENTVQNLCMAYTTRLHMVREWAREMDT